MESIIAGSSAVVQSRTATTSLTLFAAIALLLATTACTACGDRHPHGSGGREAEGYCSSFYAAASACLIPAWRASRVDPLIALQAELRNRPEWEDQEER
ncbi:MAG: hypothetical protein V3T83_06990 [Acidobacteriota bacterium]